MFIVSLINVIYTPSVFSHKGANMPKQFAMATGLGMTLGGTLLLIGSIVCLSQYFYLYYAGISHWFPLLLVGGGALVCFGVQKYRGTY